MIFFDKVDYGAAEVHEAYWKMLITNLGEDYSLDGSEKQNSVLEDLNNRFGKGRLLEVGCGDGRFLKRAQEAGWQVAGIELSKTAATVARSKYGLNVLNGPIEQVYRELGFEPFDIIMMWGVIEHLQNPAENLKVLRSLLKKGGSLVIYTPNADSIFHRLARLIYSASAGIIKFPMERLIIAMHIMYFTPQTLERLITKCNFSVSKIEMSDINLEFIFRAHKNFWWSNRIFLSFARLLQRISHLNSMHSHMIVFAE